MDDIHNLMCSRISLRSRLGDNKTLQLSNSLIWHGHSPIFSSLDLTLPSSYSFWRGWMACKEIHLMDETFWIPLLSSFTALHSHLCSIFSKDAKEMLLILVAFIAQMLKESKRSSSNKEDHGQGVGRISLLESVPPQPPLWKESNI